MTPHNLKTWPKMIWLQAEEDEPFDNTCTSETNWCAEEVFSNDVLYVRHDLSGYAAEILALQEKKLNEAREIITELIGEKPWHFGEIEPSIDRGVNVFLIWEKVKRARAFLKENENV